MTDKSNGIPKKETFFRESSLHFIYILLDPQSDAEKIQDVWTNMRHEPSISEVRTAALLAWEGYLTSIKYMSLVNLDISDIPSDQMSKLASIITDMIHIVNVTHVDHLSSILASIKCEWLWLDNVILTARETMDLVAAMRDRVETLGLYNDVDLDMEEVLRYDGRGRCSRIEVRYDTGRRCGDRFRKWAASAGWWVKRSYWLTAQRTPPRPRDQDICHLL